jgi:ribosomal protein S12 methylthiotransferase
MKLYIETLGCAKNFAEMEKIAADCIDAGLSFTAVPDDADVIVLHTCSFVDKAKQEAVDRILVLCKTKRPGQKVVMTGCFVQQYKSELEKLLPEVDKFVGTGELKNLIEILNDESMVKTFVSVPGGYLDSKNKQQLAVEGQPWKYVRIAEGCNNNCSFCIIPQLRGNYQSRPVKNIVSEIKSLVNMGVKEINLIAQDIGSYGTDIFGKPSLPELLKQILKIKQNFWIRLLYIHPRNVTDELISIMCHDDRICRYIDMPVEHVNDRLLQLCNRHVTKKHIFGLVEKLHNRVPGLVLRTSLVTGFPTETESEFSELIEFIEPGFIQRLAVFKFSLQADTKLARLFPGYKPDLKKINGWERELVKTYTNNVIRYNKTLINKSTCMLVCTTNTGRDYRFAPEIDGEILVKTGHVMPGKFVDVIITGFNKMVPNAVLKT